jgi:bacteriocin-like protein
MKTSENGVAKLQELSISEMKQINGGGYMIVIIDGKKVVIEI